MNEFPAFLLLVGATGLEPAASWSRTRRATKLRYAPEFTVVNYTQHMGDCQQKNTSAIIQCSMEFLMIWQEFFQMRRI